MKLAIDCGKNGGLAWTDENGTVFVAKMPDTVGSLVDKLRSLRMICDEVYIEKIGGFVAGSPIPGSSAFKMGENFGAVQSAASALGYRVVLVLAQKWQKPLSLGTRSSAGGYADWKRKLKAEAQRRFPSVDVTLWNADALLILDYALSERK